MAGKSDSVRPRQYDESGEGLGYVDDLTRLRSRNYSFEVRVLAALKGSFPAFSLACGATLLLLLLFLFTRPFFLAFFHAFRLRG